MLSNIKKIDIPKKHALLILMAILVFYTWIILPDFNIDGFYLHNGNKIVKINNIDYDHRLALLESHNYSWKDLNEIGAILLLEFSNLISSNFHFLPYLSSLTLLITVFFFAQKISGNNIGSLIATYVLLSSKVFFWYSIDFTYPNFWVTFLILALYPFQKYQIKSVFFMISIFMKGISFIHIPILLFQVWQQKTEKKKIFLLYVTIIVFVIIFILLFNFAGKNIGFHFEHWYYLPEWAMNLFYDPFILLSLPFMLLFLAIQNEKKTSYAGLILFGLGYSIFVPFMLILFTGYGDAHYRFLPVVVFYSLGISLFVSKTIGFFEKKLLK